MTRTHDTGQGYHNPSDPQFTTSVDWKLTTGKDESFSSEIMKNEDTTDIIDELAAMIQPNLLLYIKTTMVTRNSPTLD